MLYMLCISLIFKIYDNIYGEREREKERESAKQLGPVCDLRNPLVVPGFSIVLYISGYLIIVGSNGI